MPPSSASKSPSDFRLVVAMDRARGIGRDGGMPWHLPQDLAWFAELTTGGGDNAVVMGRRTWESIPDRFRPLPRRRNLVVTRQAGYYAEGAEVADSLQAALESAWEGGAASVFVIGGGEIYAQALQHPRCGDLYITEIDADFGCTVTFPTLEGFHRVEVLGEEQPGPPPFRFTRWSRATSD